MKKSKVILIVAIVVISLLVILLGAGVIAYFTTDFLKSDQQLFFKYLAKNDKIIEEFTKNEDDTVLKNIKQDKHIVDTEITFNLESNYTEIASQTIPVRNFSIKSTAKSDPLNKKDSRETTLKYLNEDLFKLEYLRNDDKYALTSDEVVNKYLTFENNNLKELAAKYGILDTSMIPDKIEEFNLEEYLYMDEETEKEINDKYSQLIINQIPKNNYSKEKDVTILVNNQNVKANSYSLQLTAKEAIDIYMNLLEAFKNDEMVLNVMLEQSKMINGQVYTSTDDVKDAIQNLIDELTNIQIDETENIRITVYENNGETIRTELGFGESSITFDPQYNSTQARVIINFNMQGTDTLEPNYVALKTIEIAKESSNEQSTVIVVATLETYGNSTVKVSVQSKTNVGSSIQNDTLININIADIMYLSATINTLTTSDASIQVADLTEENSVIINDLTPEYMESLMEQIANRLQALYTTKLEYINTIQQQNNTNNENLQGNNTQDINVIENIEQNNTISNTII